MYKKREENLKPTIPVFVDSVKKSLDFKITRLIFFVISYEKDRENWTKDLDKKRIPYILIGAHCIIYKPFGIDKKFGSVNDIKKLFSSIRKESFFIDTDHILIPNSYFKHIPKRGEVYRLDIPVFKKGFQFANELTYYEDFNDFFKKQKEKISKEEVETEIFYKWEQEKNEEEKKIHDGLLIQSKAVYLEYYLDWIEESELRRR